MFESGLPVDLNPALQAAASALRHHPGAAERLAALSPPACRARRH